MITKSNPPAWDYEFTCKECRAKLVAETLDLKFREGVCHYVACPYCGTEELPRDVPTYVLAVALYRYRNEKVKTMARGHCTCGDGDM